MLHSNKIPLAKTGIYACGVSHQTAVASAKPDTAKQENSRLVDLYRFLLADNVMKAPIIYMKEAGYKDIKRLRKKGLHKPKPYMHGTSTHPPQGSAPCHGA